LSAALLLPAWLWIGALFSAELGVSVGVPSTKNKGENNQASATPSRSPAALFYHRFNQFGTNFDLLHDDSTRTFGILGKQRPLEFNNLQLSSIIFSPSKFLK